MMHCIQRIARLCGPAAAGVICLVAISSSSQATTRPEAKLSSVVITRVNSLMTEGLLNAPIPVIVQTWGFPDDAEMAAVESLGGEAGRPFTTIHGFPASVPVRSLTKLALSPRIKRISYDWPVNPHADVEALSTKTRLAIRNPAKGTALSGRGVTVALLDSGISDTADFNSSVTFIAEIDIVQPDGRYRDPFGHGTHVAGIMAGSGAASSNDSSFQTFKGIASGAKLISVKVLDHLGQGQTSTVIEGVDWVVKNHELHNIKVMLVPLGHPVDESYLTDPLCQALEVAWKAGVTVVVSAGNQGGNGYASITSPGNDPMVITVGAAEDWNTPELSDDLVASFSSRGPSALDGVIKPDIIAPGTGIVSLRSEDSYLDTLLPEMRVPFEEYREDLPEEEDDSPYMVLSGTSMAASMVAGTAALLLEQDPDAFPDDIKARLMIGAAKMNDSIVARGAGLLDVEASLEMGKFGVASLNSRSPQLLVIYDEQGVERVQVQDIGTAWGDPFTWFSPNIWGDSATWGISDLWADTAVWEEHVTRIAGHASGPDDAVIWAIR